MKKHTIIVLTLILVFSTISAFADGMQIIDWTHGLNTPWRARDWSNNEDDHYFVVLSSGLDDDCIRDLMMWLNTSYAIPCIAYQAVQEEAGQRIQALLNEDPGIEGILMYGYDWMAIDDTIQECTEREMPVWVSEKTEYNEITKELEGLFANKYERYN